MPSAIWIIHYIKNFTPQQYWDIGVTAQLFLGRKACECSITQTLENLYAEKAEIRTWHLEDANERES